MEASEVGRRIFWRHRWLLLVLMILPAAGVVALKERSPVTYAATAIVQGQDTTPDASTQVSAIQSRVDAVATDPKLVQAAMNQAKISGNATQVAKHDISVSPWSSSAIMAMTVTDKSPQVALALSVRLANAVVNELNVLGVNGNPEIAQLDKTNAELSARKNQLLTELNTAGASNASSSSVQVQSLLSQLAAAEQELANNESEQQQVLATLTTETGASVVSEPTAATGASRHAVVYGALAGLLGLVVGLLFATLRDVLRPTVAEPSAGARELGAVMFGTAQERSGRIVALGRDMPERLNLAAHRAGVLTVVLTGPGSPDRLASLAARLRANLPSPERGEGRPLTAARIEADHGGDGTSPSGDPRRPAVVDVGHRPVGLATDRPTDIATARPPQPARTVVTLNEIRLGAPPPDAALVVVLPRFAPHSALDQAADLGVTADWPILGVIGIRRRSWLASLDRLWGTGASKDPATHDREIVTNSKAPDDVHVEGEND